MTDLIFSVPHMMRSLVIGRGVVWGSLENEMCQSEVPDRHLSGVVKPVLSVRSAASRAVFFKQLCFGITPGLLWDVPL
jgi:hypothetical protein